MYLRSPVPCFNSHAQHTMKEVHVCPATYLREQKAKAAGGSTTRRLKMMDHGKQVCLGYFASIAAGEHARAPGAHLMWLLVA